MTEAMRAWRAHGSQAEITTFSYHLEDSASAPPPPYFLHACNADVFRTSCLPASHTRTGA